MNSIGNLNASSKQNLNVSIGDGTVLILTFNFIESQQGWFLTFSHPKLISPANPLGQINNLRLVNSPNMLRAFRNIIPFGIACVTKDGYEPGFVSDFINGRVFVYILNATDVAQVEAEFL